MPLCAIKMRKWDEKKKRIKCNVTILFSISQQPAKLYGFFFLLLLFFVQVFAINSSFINFVIHFVTCDNALNTNTYSNFGLSFFFYARFRASLTFIRDTHTHIHHINLQSKYQVWNEILEVKPYQKLLKIQNLRFYFCFQYHILKFCSKWVHFLASAYKFFVGKEKKKHATISKINVGDLFIFPIFRSPGRCAYAFWIPFFSFVCSVKSFIRFVTLDHVTYLIEWIRRSKWRREKKMHEFTFVNFFLFFFLLFFPIPPHHFH